MAAKAKPRAAQALALGDPLTKVPGVGARRAQEFHALGVYTAQDLLTLWPRRHQFRGPAQPVVGCLVGETVTVVGTILDARTIPRPGRGLMLQVRLADRTGTLKATFFHAQYLTRVLKPGVQVAFFGTVERRGYELTMTHPEWWAVDNDDPMPQGWLPIYPLSGSLKQRFVQGVMNSVVPRLAPAVADPLPEGIRRSLSLPNRSWAIHHIHFPDSEESLHIARRRLIFDEFLRVSMAVLMLKGTERHPGMQQMPHGPLASRFIRNLPFDLTPGQDAAWLEIAADLGASAPMARLLQGEVGSGKTVIGALTLLAALDAGHQAAFMAPTEVLAEQQAAVLRTWLEPLGLHVDTLTGSDSESDMRAVRERMADGTCRLVVGTQALLSSGVEFADLGVVVIDEQHRFGVRQRALLSSKGIYPDLLVMTATPIPRTLALTLYGDLAISRIEGLPPGRQPITTAAVPEADRRTAYLALRQAVRQGHQGYVVCSTIDPDGDTGLRAAQKVFEGMHSLGGWRVGLVHGKLARSERENVMAAFRAGNLDVLVATTVIEVGIDVPNATVMIIEDADRFGLAQLHQLRGRIGRGAWASSCYLIADAGTEEAEQRLQAMVDTQDGLALAERDLAIRGPGDILGMRQHGLQAFRLADPVRDLDVLELARRVAREVLERDPRLRDEAWETLAGWVQDAIQGGMPASVLH